MFIARNWCLSRLICDVQLMLFCENEQVCPNNIILCIVCSPSRKRLPISLNAENEQIMDYGRHNGRTTTKATLLLNDIPKEIDFSNTPELFTADFGVRLLALLALLKSSPLYC